MGAGRRYGAGADSLYKVQRSSRHSAIADTMQTCRLKRISKFQVKGLILMAPRPGFEPGTIRLTVECSTAELSGNKRTQGGRAREPYNKASVPCKGRNGLLGSFFRPVNRLPKSKTKPCIFGSGGAAGWQEAVLVVLRFGKPCIKHEMVVSCGQVCSPWGLANVWFLDRAPENG
jgi:hypothetical protein